MPCISFCQVCESARLDNRNYLLGTIYDRLVRKSWAERAAANEVGSMPLYFCRCILFLITRISPQEGFDVNKVCLSLDADMLIVAKQDFDR